MKKILLIVLGVLCLGLFSCSSKVEQACVKLVESVHGKADDSKVKRKVKQCVKDYEKGDRATKIWVDEVIKKM